MTKAQMLDDAIDAFLKIDGRALRLQMGCKETIAEFQTFSMGYFAGYEAAIAAGKISLGQAKEAMNDD